MKIDHLRATQGLNDWQRKREIETGGGGDSVKAGWWWKGIAYGKGGRGRDGKKGRGEGGRKAGLGNY